MQKKRKTKDIYFKEIQSRGNRFHEKMSLLPTSPAVLTLHIPLNPFNDYCDIIRIISFKPTLGITDNGISRPKIITCIGNNNLYNILFIYCKIYILYYKLYIYNV